MFLQTAQSPAIAPFVKISKLVSELAYSLDLDPDEILNDPEEAAIMAQIIGMQMLDKQLAGSNPIVNNPEVWEVLRTPAQPQELGPTGTGSQQHRNRKCSGCRESEFSGTLRAARSRLRSS